MQNPFADALRPEQLYAASAERFFELLKSFTPPAAPAAPAAGAPNFASLAAPLAAQFEQWLKLSQAGGPWSAAAGAAAGSANPFTAGLPPGLGVPPLGPAAVPRPEAQRSFELLTRLAQLQGQLGAQWAEIAQGAAQRFVARAGVPHLPPTAAGSPRP